MFQSPCERDNPVKVESDRLIDQIGNQFDRIVDDLVVLQVQLFRDNINNVEVLNQRIVYGQVDIDRLVPVLEYGPRHRHHADLQNSLIRLRRHVGRYNRK